MERRDKVFLAKKIVKELSLRLIVVSRQKGREVRYGT
nr:MAG TPA: hypothetical protein [Caudoviricetes sp.]